MASVPGRQRLRSTLREASLAEACHISRRIVSFVGRELVHRACSRNAASTPSGQTKRNVNGTTAVMTTENERHEFGVAANADAAEGFTGAESDTEAPHILIVDDNRDILRVMRRILSSRGYRISEAIDGEEALEKAHDLKPDLLLLDVMLPKMDGLEVCRALRADPETNEIMIILVTGRASVDHRVRGFEAGADDYVPKPFHVPELLARTNSALRLKRLRDRLEERNRMLLKSQNDLFRAEKMATIGLLASGIAHEFNNIMMGISAYAQLAKRGRAPCR